MPHVVHFAGGMLCTFVESFQGQYTDGTNGTCDFRMVSASFLILRIVILASFQDRHLFGDCYLIWRLSSQCVLLASVSSFYAIAKPHKLSFMNNVDILILLLLRVRHSTHGTDILYLLRAG